MKIFSKTETPIFYKRTIKGVVYQLQIDKNGIDLSTYPEEVKEDIFKTWGDKIVEGKAAQEKPVPQVTPSVHEEPAKPVEDKKEEQVEKPEGEAATPEPAEATEEKKDEAPAHKEKKERKNRFVNTK